MVVSIEEQGNLEPTKQERGVCDLLEYFINLAGVTIVSPYIIATTHRKIIEAQEKRRFRDLTLAEKVVGGAGCLLGAAISVTASYLVLREIPELTVIPSFTNVGSIAYEAHRLQ